MFKIFKKTAAYAVAVGAVLASTQAFAVYTVNINQVGPDVVATGSGTLNVSGLGAGTTGGLTTSVKGYVNPSSPTFGLHADGSIPARSWAGAVSNSGPLGSGVLKFADTGTGDLVQVSTGGNLMLATTYVSGAALNSSETWNAATFTTLGLTPGTYTFSFGAAPNADNIIVNVIAAPVTATNVPTLTQYALLLLAGLMAFFGVSTVRKRGLF